jgi:hypothetical protein
MRVAASSSRRARKPQLLPHTGYFAPIYPEASELAAIIASPYWRHLAAGDDHQFQRFLIEVRRRIGQPDYQPRGDNDPIAHWIGTDSWRAASHRPPFSLVRSCDGF